jgi:hypothetical protein
MRCILMVTRRDSSPEIAQRTRGQALARRALSKPPVFPYGDLEIAAPELKRGLVLLDGH